MVLYSTETEAIKVIEAQLSKRARRTGAKAEAAEDEGDAEGEADDADGDDTTVADEAA